MKTDAIRTWLQRTQAKTGISYCAFSVLGFVGGVVVLFLTFWFTYAVVYFVWSGVSALSDLAISKKLPSSHEWRLACAGIFIVLLFMQHLRTNPWHWGEYPQRDDYSPLAGHALGVGALLCYPGASANLIADILLTGPRLVCGSFALLKQGRQLGRLDAGPCAELLVFLAAQNSAVSYDELRGAGWENWLPQLKTIEGVRFLEKGIALSDDLRRELVMLSET